MDIKGSRTEQVLSSALSREVQVRARYRFYAETARKQGLWQVADFFESIAANEGEHAAREFHFLGGAPDTLQNLEQAAAREFEEAHKLYPQAAEIAREEGFAEISEFLDRTANVEEKHGNNMQLMFNALKNSHDIKGKTVGHSAVRIAQTMMPDQTNPLGFVHGGELMKLIDNAAAIVALRHSRHPSVTAEVDAMTFKKSVRVGDLVTVDARMTFTSRSTMEVLITADAETVLTGEKREVLTAYFIFVALDSGGKPIEVPPLIISTEEEERLFAEGQARYERRKQQRNN